MQQEDKLVNAMIFFCNNTRQCYKPKLFKLLYFLDFEIFRETGHSVTGLHYFAGPIGPVPPVLLHNDLAMLLHRGFDPLVFTPRELRKLDVLAEVFREATAAQMVEATRLKHEPWRQVYMIEGKREQEIPYMLALDGSPGSLTKEQLDIIEQEQREIEAMFG